MRGDPDSHAHGNPDGQKHQSQNSGKPMPLLPLPLGGRQFDDRLTFYQKNFAAVGGRHQVGFY